ncbi:MAG: hypothetical protein JRJ84_05860 [Deltaproteobacteria bacterium]|nr:hypothetical protein [Deltaproteobacteria bacterium]
MARWACLFLCAMWPFVAGAVEQVEVWGTSEEPGVPEAFQAWHTQYEDDGNYGESWFFMTHTSEGGALYALLSITNLGLRTYDGSIDIQYYPPEGEAHRYHREVRRAELAGSEEQMDITVGGGHAWGGGRAYHLEVDEPGVQLRLDLTNRMDPYRFGNGKLVFFEDRSAEWAMGINVPSGEARGSLTMNGQTWDLAGSGYHDHTWTTIKLPSAMDRWRVVRILGEQFDLVLHNQHFTKKFGGGDNNFGLLAIDGRRVATSRNFVLSPTATRKVAKVDMPTAFEVALDAGGWKVEGTLTEERFHDSIDVLAQVSFPVRVAIKAFYSNPRMQRYAARYELDVTDPEGVTEHLSGECLVEANTF